MSLCMRKQTVWVSDQVDTNRSLQLQNSKMARCLKFRIYEEEDLYYPCSESKALTSFAVTAKLVWDFVFAYANCWFSDAVAQM